MRDARAELPPALVTTHCNINQVLQFAKKQHYKLAACCWWAHPLLIMNSLHIAPCSIRVRAAPRNDCRLGWTQRQQPAAAQPAQDVAPGSERMMKHRYGTHDQSLSFSISVSLHRTTTIARRSARPPGGRYTRLLPQVTVLCLAACSSGCHEIGVGVARGWWWGPWPSSPPCLLPDRPLRHARRRIFRSPVIPGPSTLPCPL